MSVTFKPLASSNVASDAAAIPFPKDETTPPVINTYLVIEHVTELQFQLSNLLNKLNLIYSVAYSNKIRQQKALNAFLYMLSVLIMLSKLRPNLAKNI